jgi:hypothetical protein
VDVGSVADVSEVHAASTATAPKRRQHCPHSPGVNHPRTELTSTVVTQSHTPMGPRNLYNV